MLRPLLFLVLSLALCGPASAQMTQIPESDLPVIAIGRVSIDVGLPTGAFRENLQASGVGGSIFAARRLGQTPLYAGMNVGLLFYGANSDTVPFTSDTGSQIDLDVVTVNGIFQPHLVLRLQPAEGRFRPYAEGLFGFKYLFTITGVEDKPGYRNEYDAVEHKPDAHDVALSGGAGAGLDVRLYHGAPNTTVAGISLQLGAQYLVGQRAKYLSEEVVENRTDTEPLDFLRSTTTLLQPQFGLAVQLR